MKYEEILKSMLDKVPNDLDKREGSIIYNALAPAAAELAQMYVTLENNVNLVFADTAVDLYLDRLSEQIGITRKEATASIRKGIFYNANDEFMNVDIGTRYSIGSTVYVVIEKIDKGIYKLQCETLGKEGNTYIGDLVPVQYIDGLARAELTDILIPGEDVESDDALRERYFENINEKTFAGNIADYKIKTKGIEGVGAVKVTPIWNGPGTVKLTILDSQYSKATNELIDKAQLEVCPNITDEGLGLAPIGHQVTITTVEEISLNLATTVTLTETSSIEMIKEQITEILNNYLLELRKNWENVNGIIVRIAQIEARILNLEGVLDIENTSINGNKSNLELEAGQIPIVGEVVVE